MNDKSTFMGKYAVLVYASILAVAVGGYATYRIENHKKQFSNTVAAKLKVSAGYDSLFTSMVNKLEDELAERASFGYMGRRDPMTGAVRQVAAVRPINVRQQQQGPQGRRGAAAAHTPPPAETAAVEVEQQPIQVVEAPDPVRLTAIISDKGANTAIVMNGDRSLSVEVGDRVAGRRITRITESEIFMENDVESFRYHILGGSTRTQK